MFDPDLEKKTIPINPARNIKHMKTCEVPIMGVYHNQMINKLRIDNTKEVMHKIIYKKAIEEEELFHKQEKERTNKLKE